MFLRISRPFAFRYTCYIFLFLCLVATVLLCLLVYLPSRNLILCNLLPGPWKTVETSTIIRMHSLSQLVNVGTCPEHCDKILIPTVRKEDIERRNVNFYILKYDPIMYEGERWRFLPLLSKQEKIDLLYILEVMAEALDRSGLSYFLVDGTLLGLVRTRGILPWDDDIDVALNGSQWTDIKQVLCCVEGFTLIPKDIMHWKFFLSNGTIIRNSPEHNFPFVDLFLYAEDEEFIWSLTRYNLRNLLFRKTEIFPLTRATFDGKLYPVPRLSEHIVRTQFLDLNMCVSPSMFHKYNLALDDNNIAHVDCDVLKPMYKLFNSMNN